MPIVGAMRGAIEEEACQFCITASIVAFLRAQASVTSRAGSRPLPCCLVCIGEMRCSRRVVFAVAVGAEWTGIPISSMRNYAAIALETK